MALYVHLMVYVGLSLFIISGLYVYMVVCIVYTYNLTICHLLWVDFPWKKAQISCSRMYVSAEYPKASFTQIESGGKSEICQRKSLV